MKVVLAGYNVDADIISELKQKAGWSENNVTPETLSAAYARISRDPDDITKLREFSRKEVDKSRKSNETIIFGLGHASVAEHAVFNFDIIGLSRLAVEEVQRFRLASFTEKSQRYITLDADFIVPEKIAAEGLEKKFVSVVNLQNRAYETLYEGLKSHLFKKHAALIETPAGARTVDGWAKEDARYAVSLATKSQFGMTINARELEHVLKKFACSNLREIRVLGQKMFELVKDMSPSIIKYVTPALCDSETPKMVRKESSRFMKDICSKPEIMTKIAYHTPNGDEMLIASILFSSTGFSYEECLERADKMEYAEKYSLVKTALSNRAFYDGVERYFEMADIVFELIVSASNYAQLKRHRMTTQLASDYNIDLGVTIPPNISEIGMERVLLDVMRESEEFYNELKYIAPDERDYILTNAHRRKVLVKINIRELYHFISLRDDDHAQWDIRATAKEMKELAEKVMPLSTMMLCGKSDFKEKCSKIF